MSSPGGGRPGRGPAAGAVVVVEEVLVEELAVADRRSSPRSGSAWRARCRRSRAAAPWPAPRRGCSGRAAGTGPRYSEPLAAGGPAPQRDQRHTSHRHPDPRPHPEHARTLPEPRASHRMFSRRAADVAPASAHLADAGAAGFLNPARAAPPPRAPPRPSDGARPGALRRPVRAAHPGHALLGDARPDGDHGAARGDLARRRPGRHLDLPARDASPPR